MLTTEVDMLRKENSNLTQRLRAASDHVIENPSATNTRIFSYTEFKNFKICKQNGCRVMCTHPNNKLIIISKKSENPNLFPGYGICKLNLDNMDCKNFSTEFIRLHKSRIRDMSISPFEPASLLTCSLDKTIRITNLANNALVQEYLCDYPIWSCMWDPETPTRIYAGLANGTVTIFDIRNTTRSAETVVLDYSTTSTRLHGSPVVSLQPISIKVAKNSYISGIATATSEHVFVIEKQDSCFKSHLVSQPSGRVMSMATDATHRRCLISQRPKGFVKNCQQTVGKFSKTISKDNTEAYKFTSEFMIGGGSCSTLLTRSTIYSPMNSDELCVAFGNEDDCSIYLSGLKSASVCKIVSKYGNVVDLSPIWYDQWHYLLGLTESDCTLYKYIV
ncbi:E3 ubiquitin-protein ligase RFWD3 [Thelohanellus kitauei]|uniref:RING-type E3 ubiquitin transferase n=1 Tax=Thelohanellus kitauei TaxID=669202 RepID=A0A0C2N3W3_THEKT|nr:E3 ubiquitin-protein ligase RFWD3 [Thelohanellus kitauei]